jgi:hypothetical protein
MVCCLVVCAPPCASTVHVPVQTDSTAQHSMHSMHMYAREREREQEQEPEQEQQRERAATSLNGHSSAQIHQPCRGRGLPRAKAPCLRHLDPSPLPRSNAVSSHRRKPCSKMRNASAARPRTMVSPRTSSSARSSTTLMHGPRCSNGSMQHRCSMSVRVRVRVRAVSDARAMHARMCFALTPRFRLA